MLTHYLQAAAENGKTKTVAMLINSGVDVNSPCEEGTALQAARNNEIAAMLIQSGAHIDIAADENGNTLTRAAAAGDKDTVQRMLAAGADPDRKSNVRRRTALSDAAEKGHTNIGKNLTCMLYLSPYKPLFRLFISSREADK